MKVMRHTGNRRRRNSSGEVDKRLIWGIAGIGILIIAIFSLMLHLKGLKDKDAAALKKRKQRQAELIQAMAEEEKEKERKMKKEWENARYLAEKRLESESKFEDAIEAMNKFCKNYPDSKYYSQGKVLLGDLKDKKEKIEKKAILENDWKQTNEIARKAILYNKDFENAVTSLNKYLEKYPESENIEKVEKMLETIKGNKKKIIAEIKQSLDDKAQPFIDGKKYEEAAKVYSSYDGKFAENLKSYCSAKASEYNQIVEKQKAEIEKIKVQQLEHVERLIQIMSMNLINGKFDRALEQFQENRGKLYVKAIAKVLIDANLCDKAIIASFKSEINQNIYISIKGKEQFANIIKINTNSVIMNVGQNVKKETEVFVSDLKPSEKMARLKNSRLSPIAKELYYAYLFRQSKDLKNCRKHLSKTGFFAKFLLDNFDKLYNVKK